MMDTAPQPASDENAVAETTTTTCVAALDSIIRLSQMSAVTYGAIAQLKELSDLCNEAGSIIGGIRADLDCDELEQDPVRIADSLERLNRMSAAVRAATDSADETILQFTAAKS